MTRSRLWSRSIQRTIHLVFPVVLGAYLYSPLADVGGVELVVQAVVFPFLALSGILLWKGPKFRQWYREF